MNRLIFGALWFVVGVFSSEVLAQTARLDRLKQQAVGSVDARWKFTQQMVDQIFSYAELGFQELETSRYVVALLRESGFTVEDEPAIERNKNIMDEFRPALRKFYFDSTNYDTYLEQLGIEYPTLRRDGKCIVGTP